MIVADLPLCARVLVLEGFQQLYSLAVCFLLCVMSAL